MIINATFYTNLLLHCLDKIYFQAVLFALVFFHNFRLENYTLYIAKYGLPNRIKNYKVDTEILTVHSPRTRSQVLACPLQSHFTHT